LQILWLNLATDSLPALALATDVGEDGLMKRKPYEPKKEILRGIIPFALLAASIAFAATFGLFLLALFYWQLPVNYARTLAFTTTVLFEFFLVFSIRSTKSAFKIGIFSNPLLWGAVTVGLLGQVLVIYHPIAQRVFDTVSLNLTDWLLVLIFASSGFTILETLKQIKARSVLLGRFIPIG